ncbi:hypothetical protein A5764_14250 [Mycobacterium sp. 852002-51057_SCH5723018]|nr:hypothetical protein A5764_14250 [Mycobacterium sp. 852002-51057_SCH5723018]
MVAPSVGPPGRGAAAVRPSLPANGASTGATTDFAARPTGRGEITYFAGEDRRGAPATHGRTKES